MREKVAKIAKEESKHRPIKSRKGGAPRCACDVKIAKDAFTVDPAIDPGQTFGTYVPIYQIPPTCRGEGCEKKVLYKWTIEVIDGNVILSDETTERAKVSGEGTYKLTLKVTVLCKKPIAARTGAGKQFFRTTVCSDTASETFSLG